MTGKQALFEKLRGEAPGPTTVSEHFEQQKAEWLVDVGASDSRMRSSCSGSNPPSVLLIRFSIFSGVDSGVKIEPRN